MVIYFVRHGLSLANISGVHQSFDDQLSEEGVREVVLLTNRLKELTFSKLLSSPLLRSKQTAEILAKGLQMPVEYSDLLKEIKMPTEIEGKENASLDVQNIISKLNQNYTDPNYHFSDEENFFDAKERVENALRFLEQEADETYLVVTHGDFLSMLVLLMMMRDELTPEKHLKYFNFFEMYNSAITICEFGNKTWTVRTWNDYAHLGLERRA